MRPVASKKEECINGKQVIFEGWRKATTSREEGKLSEQEEAQFEKARFAEDQVRKSSFLLGGQIRHGTDDL